MPMIFNKHHIQNHNNHTLNHNTNRNHGHSHTMARNGCLLAYHSQKQFY